jgi:hypothetical protein
MRAGATARHAGDPPMSLTLKPEDSFKDMSFYVSGTFPQAQSLDPSSVATAMAGRSKNSFCGVMNADTGVWYFAPYCNNNDRSNPAGDAEYPYQDRIEVNGTRRSSIIHQEGGSPGHEQMMAFVLNECGARNVPRPQSGFLGFVVIFGAGPHGGFKAHSRSQNNSFFPNWNGGNALQRRGGTRDTAFAGWIAGLGGTQGAPTLDELVSTGGSKDGSREDGAIPQQWEEEMRAFLLQHEGMKRMLG